MSGESFGEDVRTVSVSPDEFHGRGQRDPLGEAALAAVLNPPQLEAVLHPPGPLLVVAGAGSGKTRVITYRLARMVHDGADPRRILAVTFTNKAAGEMRGRVEKLLGATGLFSYGLWVGTFHSISARLLRQWGEAVGLRKDFVIYDTDDQRRLLTRIIGDLQVAEKLFPPRMVQATIDRAQNRGITALDFEAEDHFTEIVRKVFLVYEERLAAANAVDFGGLLLKGLRLCEGEGQASETVRERFDHVLVDEFQDTNDVQARMVRALARRTRSLTAVGDEDQSIYRWRGADIRHILGFEEQLGGAAVVKLEQNYRSTAHILRAANAVIARNTERRPKKLFTEAPTGDLIIAFEGDTERDEAAFVAQRIAAAIEQGASPRDFAVFYRTNAQSRALEDALRARDLAYAVVGGTRFYDRAEVKDLLAYMRVSLNPDDGVGLSRIVNSPPRGIGDATMERVALVARDRQTSLWAALVASSRDEGILGLGPRRKVAGFVELMLKLQARARDFGPAALADEILTESGYREALAADESMEAQGRLENLQELVGQMRDFEREAEEPTLAAFLERVALVADVDQYDETKGTVSLMTVHTAKGLEFDQVFLTGLEERIFPHARSIDDDEAIEEERRLCYVAITRARKRLVLSRVRRRRLGGQDLFGLPSRFLREIPADTAEWLVQEAPAESWRGPRDTTDDDGPWEGGGWSRTKPRAPRAYAPSASGRPSGSPGRAPAPPRTPTAPPGTMSVDYDDGAAPLGLMVGGRVKHPKFGVGEVRGWQGVGADLKVLVRFREAGMKTIVAKFLHPA